MVNRRGERRAVALARVVAALALGIALAACAAPAAATPGGAAVAEKIAGDRASLCRAEVIDVFADARDVAVVTRLRAVAPSFVCQDPESSDPPQLVCGRPLFGGARERFCPEPRMGDELWAQIEALSADPAVIAIRAGHIE